jgi:hypothetical protein
MLYWRSRWQLRAIPRHRPIWLGIHIGKPSQFTIERRAEGKTVSLLEKLRDESLAVNCPADPWLAPLQRVRGKVEFDGLERVSSQTLLDMLQVPQRSRTAGTYRRLAKLMGELGWTAVRLRDLTRGGYKEQVRGYVRDIKA